MTALDGSKPDAYRPLTEDQANAIYDVLVEHAGAAEDMRDDFVFHQTRQHVTEYRFQGSLGFGGKFWNYGGRWYVTASRRRQGSAGPLGSHRRHQRGTRRTQARRPIGRCPAEAPPVRMVR